MTLKVDFEDGDEYGAADINTLNTAVNAVVASGGDSSGRISVRDYGAVGDGSTDDTAAIHAARDAAGVRGTVVFPPGTYKIVCNNDSTGGLKANVASQMWNITPGATITQTNHGRALITVDAENVTITGGGTLSGVRVSLGDAAYNVSAVIMGTVNSNHLTVDNVHVTQSSYYGVWGQGSHTRVLRCTFTENYWSEVMPCSYSLWEPTLSTQET